VALGITASLALVVAGLAVTDRLPGAGDTSERVQEQATYSGPPADQGLSIQQGHGADIGADSDVLTERALAMEREDWLLWELNTNLPAERTLTTDRMDWLYWEAMNLTPPATAEPMERRDWLFWEQNTNLPASGTDQNPLPPEDQQRPEVNE
jgi:hypothetical protein